MNGILQYVILSVGLLSLSRIVLRFLQIVACINSSEQYLPQFNFFLPAKYLFFPHVLVIAHKAAINVHG